MAEWAEHRSFDTLAGPYRTIVADPPWQYRKAASASESSRRNYAEDNYQTLAMREIAALPVRALAAEDALLFLWTTAPRLYGDRGETDFNPVHVMEAWGFDYRTTMIWHKLGSPGMGAYFRIDHEFVLVGIRGSVQVPPAQRPSSILAAPRRGHSEKPEAFYLLVEQMYDGPRLDLFGRKRRLGWDVFGDQIHPQDLLPLEEAVNPRDGKPRDVFRPLAAD